MQAKQITDCGSEIEKKKNGKKMRAHNAAITWLAFYSVTSLKYSPTVSFLTSYLPV